jgi:5'-methylthioadenosine phosphorylase
LARHGRGHVLLPHEINFRANIYGMKKLGVSWLIAASAVGSLREDMRPLDFVIPDQFVDRTTQRQSTFFGDGIAAHISFADPFCGSLREELLKECKNLNISVHSRGTYLNMEGPAFSTRAESHLYRSWGMDIIGMTNLAEAKLAREAEICYATMAMVTDYDCWHEQHDDVTVEAVIQNLLANAANALKVIQAIAGHLPQTCDTGCRSALATSIITAKDKMPPATKKKLKELLQKYL